MRAMEGHRRKPCSGILSEIEIFRRSPKQVTAVTLQPSIGALRLSA